MTHTYEHKKTPKDSAIPSKDAPTTHHSSQTSSAACIPLWAGLAYGNEVPPALRLSVEPLQRKENTAGMPDTLKTGIEALSGLSMDDVHVHYNSSKPAQVQALAYTQGPEIHVGPGQERHLAHEAWHVVQQKQGRVQATTQAKGVAINDDEGLEREAEVMGTRVISGYGSVGVQDPLAEVGGKAQLKRSAFGESNSMTQKDLHITKHITPALQVRQLVKFGKIGKYITIEKKEDKDDYQNRIKELEKSKRIEEIKDYVKDMEDWLENENIDRSLATEQLVKDALVWIKNRDFYKQNIPEEKKGEEGEQKKDIEASTKPTAEEEEKIAKALRRKVKSLHRLEEKHKKQKEAVTKAATEGFLQNTLIPKAKMAIEKIKGKANDKGSTICVLLDGEGEVVEWGDSRGDKSGLRKVMDKFIDATLLSEKSQEKGFGGTQCAEPHAMAKAFQKRILNNVVYSLAYDLQSKRYKEACPSCQGNLKKNNIADLYPDLSDQN